MELKLEDEKTLQVMKALSSETRLKLLETLKWAASLNFKYDMGVCQVAEHIKTTEANASAQLKVLEKAGLIEPRFISQKHGVKKVYKLKNKNLTIIFEEGK